MATQRAAGTAPGLAATPYRAYPSANPDADTDSPSASSSQASAAGHRRGLAGRAAPVTLAVILVAGTSPPASPPPASLSTRHCRRRSSRKRYGHALRPQGLTELRGWLDELDRFWRQHLAPPPAPRPLTPPIS